MNDYCECGKTSCPVCGTVQLDTLTLSLAAKMRAAFEADANSEGNLYNLTLAPKDDAMDQTYWSLHAERAWKLYQKAFASAARIAKENSNV